MDRKPLKYAPTPPLDRAHLVPQPDGFTLTLPPRLTAGWAVSLAVALVLYGALAGLCAMIPFPPASMPAWTRLAWGLIVAPPWYAVVATVFDGVREVRAARTWTEILLAEDMLTCAVPAIRGMSRRSIPWPDVVDVRVIREVDADGAHEHLAVLRRDGGRVWLLNTDFYRQQDIAFAAETLRGRLVGP